MIGMAEALLIAAGASLVAAAACDLVRFEIPDGLSTIIFGAAIGHAALTGAPVWAHLTAAMLMFGIGAMMFRAGTMGGGDVKLLAAVAGWAGLAGFVPLVLAVAMAGGVLAVTLLAIRRLPIGDGPELVQRGAPLPYAVAIATGAFWTGAALLA